MEEFEAACKRCLRLMAPVVLAHPETFPDGMDSVRFSWDNEKKQAYATGDSIDMDLQGIGKGPPSYSSELHKVSGVTASYPAEAT